MNPAPVIPSPRRTRRPVRRSHPARHPRAHRPSLPPEPAAGEAPASTPAAPPVPPPAPPLSPAPFLVLQLADSALPTGGFAHSGGLEAAWQSGEIRDRRQLAGFLEASLRQAASASLPFVVESHRDPTRLAELDALADAWTSNHVANRASRLQGRAFWTAVTHAFLPASPPPPAPGHFAPAFGALLRRLDLPAETAAHLFLFQHLRGLVSATVRLGIVGPLEAQGLQFRFGSLLAELTAGAPALTLDDLAQSAPLLDLWQSAQDRLYSRLFQS